MTDRSPAFTQDSLRPAGLTESEVPDLMIVSAGSQHRTSCSDCANCLFRLSR